uniref:NADH-ubiquinone oxidoreductase chain 3 n=1 Tax=Dendrothrips minowai TaxID=1030662 RepID=A0A343WRN7_9NEOP|nr:NADH dehydrogenase subunit 3 [Dendrothrips minowai]AWD37106.1 NADH dehydrogenase subunit 3 [Dendrothrips minowai]
MTLMFFTIFVLFFLTLILMMISLMISKKTFNKREKLTPFECGFDFFSYSRMPFSIKFFLIAIIFIIFDIEIALMLPLIITMYKSNLFFWVSTSLIFITILLFGVILEWKEKSFDWKI